MYRRYYDGYNTYDYDRQNRGGEVVFPQSSPEVIEEEMETTVSSAECADIGIAKKHDKGLKGILDNFELDDLILIVILFLMLQDSIDDSLLIIVLGFVFLTGLFD